MRPSFRPPRGNPRLALGRKIPERGKILILGAILLLFPFTAWSQTSETPVAIAEVLLNLPIPDGDPNGVSDSIAVSGSALLESLEVALQIEHPATDELVISLTNPQGVKIILHNRTASSNPLFEPIYETRTPSAETLRTFLGSNPQGNWTLRVADLVVGRSGTLLAWGLRVQPGSLIQPLPPTPVPIPGSLFEKAADLPVEATPSNAAAGDANLDGLDDLFLLSEKGNQVAVYFSNGVALTDPPLRYTINRPQKIALADFNSDQRLDFAIASQASEAITTITVFLANYAGGFSQGFTAQISTTLDTLVAFDATADGIPDLIAGGIPYLIEGIGDGSFKPAVQLVYLGQSFHAYDDLNKDGLNDLLVTISRGGTSKNADPFVLFGSADLTFPNRQKLILDAPILDAFSARLDQSSQSQFSLVTSAPPTYLINTISGTEASQLRLNTSSVFNELLKFPTIPLDLNGDGLDELIFVSSDGVHAFQKSSNSKGGDTKPLYLHPSPKKAIPGHFFADGGWGMAVLDSSATVTLIRSTQGPFPTPTPYAPPAPTPTPFLFPELPLETPTPTPPPPTPTPENPRMGNPDLNGDGIVDRMDLLILVESWGKRIPE